MRKPVLLVSILLMALPASAQTLAQYPQGSYGQAQTPYQQQYQQPSPYGQNGQFQQQQSSQADPSVPGQSSLPAGQYELINLGTGQKRFITVTAQGQMYETSPPAVGANLQQQAPGGYPGAYPQQGYSPQMGQQAGMPSAQSAQAPGGYPGQPSVVGSAIRGALGQYYNSKFGAAGNYPGSPAAMPSGAAAGYGYSAPGGGAPGTPF